MSPRRRKTTNPWTVQEEWVARASRSLSQGRLISAREFDRLLRGDADLQQGLSLSGSSYFLKRFDAFFREEQKPLLRESLKRWSLQHSKSLLRR